jgi:hypothetical protein
MTLSSWMVASYHPIRDTQYAGTQSLGVGLARQVS